MRIHIACTIDEGYVEPLRGMLSSFFIHHHGIPVSIHVLTGSISAGSQSAIEQFIRERGADYHHYTIPSNRFEEFSLHYAHFSKANFYRLLIPDLITTTERILYLDVDVLVRHSLSPLYSTDLRGFPIAAAPDAVPPLECKRLGIPEHLSYFNSGVMVMDLPFWRRDHIAEQALNYLLEHNGNPDRCRYVDQDGLNVILQGQWLPLSETWNFNIFHGLKTTRTLTPAQRSHLESGPAIVHFANNKKPWKREFVLPFQQEFLVNARRNGIRYKRPLSFKNFKIWFKETRKLRKQKSSYHLAGIPWRA